MPRGIPSLGVRNGQYVDVYPCACLSNSHNLPRIVLKKSSVGPSLAVPDIEKKILAAVHIYVGRIGDIVGRCCTHARCGDNHGTLK